jgi:hypothetical protein
MDKIINDVFEVEALQQNPELGRVGKVSLALWSLDTDEGRNRYHNLLNKAQSYRSAQAASDEATSNEKLLKQVQPKLAKMFVALLEGYVAELIFLDPNRAGSMPMKSSLELNDPTAWAGELEIFFAGGNSREKENAKALRHAVERYQKAGAEYQAAIKVSADALKQAKSAKLHLDEYMKQCERYINDHAPKDAIAHQHLKRKPRGPNKPKPTPPGTPPSGDSSAPAKASSKDQTTQR